MYGQTRKPPSFIFGGNTGKSLAEIRQGQAQARQALSQASSATPRNVGEGLSAIGRSIAAGLQGRAANKQADAYAQKQNDYNRNYQNLMASTNQNGMTPENMNGMYGAMGSQHASAIQRVMLQQMMNRHYQKQDTADNRAYQKDVTSAANNHAQTMQQNQFGNAQLMQQQGQDFTANQTNQNRQWKLQQQAQKPVVVGNNLVNPMTGEVIYAPEDSETDFKTEQHLRKEFEGRTGIEAFRKVRDAYNRINATDSTGAGDMSLIFNYMKMLDPGSVVRESEFALAAKSGDYGEQIQGMINRVLTGERLTDPVRNDFLQQAQNLYGAQAKTYNTIAEQYRGLGTQYGLNPDRIAELAELASQGNPEAQKALEGVVEQESNTPSVSGEFSPEVQALLEKYSS